MDEKLQRINGTPELDKCIKMVFNPAEFINRLDTLRSCLEEFNQYLAFDGWNVEVKNTSFEIHKVIGPDIESKLKKCDEAGQDMSEFDFLRVEFEEIGGTGDRHLSQDLFSVSCLKCPCLNRKGDKLQ